MLPDPPIPPDCDVADMPFMQWQVRRFLKSDLRARATPVEGWAAILLWNEAWERVPAGSLPDDDRSLANLVGYGLAVWMRAKPVALHNWVRCSDGRLYHPVVSEKVLEAWIERLAYRRRSAMGNAKRHNKVFDPVPFDEALADAQSRLAILLARSAQGLLLRSQGKGEGSKTLPGGSASSGKEGFSKTVGDDPLGGGPRLSVVGGSDA